MILYDESNIYFNNQSTPITIKEKQLISYLSENIFITAFQVNMIISDQEYAKSHFTSLRSKLIKALMKSFLVLLITKIVLLKLNIQRIIELKFIKADSSIIKKK